IVPTACGQAADINIDSRPPRACLSARRRVALQCSEIAHRSRLASRSTLGAILPLHDVRYQSVITRPLAASQPTHGRGIVFDGRALMSKSVISKSIEELDDELRFDCFEEDCFEEDDRTRSRLVEPDGIEPTTSCLQSRRSPN